MSPFFAERLTASITANILRRNNPTLSDRSDSVHLAAALLRPLIRRSSGIQRGVQQQCVMLVCGGTWLTTGTVDHFCLANATSMKTNTANNIAPLQLETRNANAAARSKPTKHSAGLSFISLHSLSRTLPAEIIAVP